MIFFVILLKVLKLFILFKKVVNNINNLYKKKLIQTVLNPTQVIWGKTLRRIK